MKRIKREKVQFKEIIFAIGIGFVWKGNLYFFSPISWIKNWKKNFSLVGWESSIKVKDQ